MKKAISLMLVVVVMLGLFGCKKKNDFENKPHFTGVVEKVCDKAFIVYCEEISGYPYGARCSVSKTTDYKDSYTDVSIGDIVTVYYGGEMKETDPLQLDKVYAIKLESDKTTN